MDKKEINSNTGVSEFQNFEKQASELTEMHFRRVVKLDTISAYKRTETLEKIFSHFEYSKDILTTKDYEMSDFKNCKLQWGSFQARGHFSVQTMAKNLESAITKYLSSKDLIDCLGNIQIIKVRDVWVKVNTYAEDVSYKPFEDYI
ncbi:hypothetical protein JCM33374_g3361 [Metschnikowia sp. JCM 33374]|nr:hypothetical protein JCM33374_g3361 [Metschnikowia sp. JCM 33374]